MTFDPSSLVSGGIGHGKVPSLTPGSDAKRARAEQEATDAAAQWQNLQPPTLSDQPTTTYNYNYNPLGLPDVPLASPVETPANIQQYATGGSLTPVQTSSLDTPEARIAAGLAPTSAAEGKTSAYGDLGPSSYSTLGPSAFKDATSAYGSLGPSAATGLAFDKQSLAGERGGADYFSNLSKTGSDPIAEADYQKRAMQAEQARKQNTDAALASLEAKGLGNAGGQMAARTGGIQDAANARYQAGLDATAMAAGRRDTAAKTGADISHTAGTDVLIADKARADALDKYNQARAAGLDDFTAKRASGLDQFDTTVAGGKDTYNTNVAGGKDTFTTNQDTALDSFANQRYDDWYKNQGANADRATAANTGNTERGWTVGDTNTALHNALPQQNFNNKMAVAGGTSNALLGAGSLTQQGATASGLGVLPQAATAVGNVLKAVKPG